jgi:PAS domain S-box-containing protein
MTTKWRGLEESHARFVKLYDLAPSGYVTLDGQGVIRRCNLTAAAFIGRSKGELEGMPFIGCVVPADRERCAEFFQRCGEAASDLDTELLLQTAHGERCAQILCRPLFHDSASPEFLTALIDGTERKALERERARLAREHAALVSQLMAVQEAERARIARTLHDDIGQEATALRLMLERLAADPAVNGPMLARVRQSLDAFDRRLHFIASELRPAALDLGVAAALEQFARRWAATFGVRAEFRSTDAAAGALNPDAETHLYRIAQEALNNVSKHAAATRVWIVLERCGADLRLEIRDDGRGFDPEAGAAASGLGLIGMRERAQLVGGALTVSSRTGDGTTVSLRVSVAAPSAEPDRKQRL